MTHARGRASSAKEKPSKISYKKIHPPTKDILTRRKGCGDCTCVNCCKSDCHHRMKRLLTRKERNYKRDVRKEPSQGKTWHLSYRQPCSKDVTQVHQCCHSTTTTSALALGPSVCVSHEPSIITDSRLIGHQGLFNHEVKSIDIERLLSVQRKLDRNEKLSENSYSSLTKAVSDVAAEPPFSERQCLLDSDEEAGGSNKKSQSSNTFTRPHVQENAKMEFDCQSSDVSPGKRPRKKHSTPNQTNFFENFSKHSSCDANVSEIREAQPALFDNSSETHPTPASFHKNPENVSPSAVSYRARTPQKPVSASKHAQAHCSSPHLPSSQTLLQLPNSLDPQENSLVSDSISTSVRAVAASLCNSISYSVPRRRNPVDESRDRLWGALRQRHGRYLHKNILKIRKKLYSTDHEIDHRDFQELCHMFANEERPFSSGDFLSQFGATSSFVETEREPLNWNSTDSSNPFDPTADWFGIPAENPVFPNDIFSHGHSPLFSLDFESKNPFSREREPPFPLSCSLTSVDDFFVGAKEEGLANPYYMHLDDQRRPGYRGSPLSTFVNNHCRFDPHHSDSVVFPQGYSSFETHQYSQSFSEVTPYFQHGNSFESFSHLRPPSATPVVRNHCVNLAEYPPSYLLERDSSLSTGSHFPSPEHWSFPPMRLY